VPTAPIERVRQSSAPVRTSGGWLAFDKLGIAIGVILAAGALLPFATFRANRIVPGSAVGILDALPGWAAALLIAVLLGVIFVALVKSPGVFRLLASFTGLAAIALLAGFAATYLTPVGNTYARVSPASGFWLLTFGLALLATDAFTRLRPTPAVRVAVLVGVGLAVWALLGSGSWDGLSIMKEYANRADSFWTEVGRHVTLAIGSLLAAVLAGLPLGILCHRVPRLRAATLSLLNMVQTIPSIALFGLLIAPLAWIAANIPGASAVGIRGIGGAPAFVALFLYSLLPVVANTVVGLAGVSPAANDAARGVGMTDRQRLFSVELPLALPLILTGIRIVLVQNIGMATIAALIGGGGLGVFVFQGIGQTALDLVLLGALPTVAMAFAAAVILDAGIELSTPAGAKPR
jgi:osmoprotectant transport system permease protein